VSASLSLDEPVLVVATPSPIDTQVRGGAHPPGNAHCLAGAGCATPRTLASSLPKSRRVSRKVFPLENECIPSVIEGRRLLAEGSDTASEKA